MPKTLALEILSHTVENYPQQLWFQGRGTHRGTSLMRNTLLLGPYSGTIPRVLWCSFGRGGVSYEGGTPGGHIIYRSFPVARELYYYQPDRHACAPPKAFPYRGTSLIR